MMGLIKFEDIFSRVGILQYMNVTDRQTDRQTDGPTPADSKDRAYAYRRAVKAYAEFRFFAKLKFYLTTFLPLNFCHARYIS